MKKRMAIACMVLIALILLVVGAILFFLLGDSETAADGEASLPAPTAQASSEQELTASLSPSPEAESLPSPALGADGEDPLLAVEPHQSQIQNILLYRKTSDALSDPQRDFFLLLTVDKNQKSLTLTALAPESYLQIRGAQSLYWDQLKAACAHDGLNRLINTLNAPENYALDIQDSFGTDRERFAALIDALGGLSLPLSKEACFLINWKYAGLPADASKASRFNRLEEQQKAALLEQEGVQELNGQQILCYLEGDPLAVPDSSARSIYDPMERMQQVLVCLYRQIRETTDLSGLVSLVQTLQNHVDTNLSQDALIDLGAFLLSNELEIRTLCLPREEASHYAEEPMDGEGGVFSTLRFDMDAERNALWQALYGIPYGEVLYEGN